jgi:3-phenylpropionate/cinnamic acid dioxygenase small subunit
VSDGAPPASRRRSVDTDTYLDVLDWLNWEAELLDRRDFQTWLTVLDPGIRYRMPVPVTIDRRSAGHVPLGAMDHFDEDLYSLQKRVQRLDGEYAWTEDPPSRTRRFVTNVRVRPLGADQVEVRSYLLLHRSRGDVRPAELISADRVDVLRRRGSTWTLMAREITMDEAVLRMQNLAVFL